MTYDARPREVMDALEDAPYDEETKAKMKVFLGNYFQLREGLIANSLDCLGPGHKGSCYKAWYDRGLKNLETVRGAFQKAEVGKLWLAKISNEEFRFFNQLLYSRVPVHRDRMVKHNEALTKAMQEFANKWRKLKDDDASIDDKIQRTSEEFDKLLVKAARKAAKVEKEAREKTAEQVRKTIGRASAFVDGGIIEAIINGGAYALQGLVGETKSRRYEIFALLSHKQKLFGTFQETREIVEEFVEENGYPMIKDAWDDGDAASNVTVTKMVTDGQKSDAAIWAKEAREELAKVFAVAEQAYREFAKQHEYLFFGPLGSGYYKELSEDDSWKSFSQRWRDHREDFDDLLRDRTLAASESQILEVSLDGLDRKQRKQIYNELYNACRELQRSWNNVKEVAKNSSDEIMDTRENVNSAIEAMT